MTADMRRGIFLHDGWKRAIRGFSLPAYAKMSLLCLFMTMFFHLRGYKGHEAELLAFFSPLFLMAGFLLCVCFALMMVSFVTGDYLTRRRGKESLARQHRESLGLLLGIFAYLAPIALLAFSLGTIPYATWNAGIFRLSATVFLIYFGVGVCFATANGIANMRRMFAAERGRR